MNNVYIMLLTSGLLLACGDSKSSDTGTCEVAEDCETLHYNWDSICEGDTLVTPTGTGLPDCIEGQCVTDFELVETDCTAQGQVCDSSVDVGGDACVDPS